jgi:hypothetical protein
MKTLFSFALLALLVMPVANASAMTVDEFETALAKLNQQLVALQALILDQNSALISTDVEDSAVVSQVGQVAGVQASVSEKFMVTVDDIIVFSTDTDLNSGEAYTICESYAYEYTNYFKNVVCDHNSETIYDNTFIPG